MDDDPQVATVSLEFTVDDLRRVRDLVERAAMATGLTGAETDNLVIAVNEIAANAIVYAGGSGVITVGQGTRGLLVEIADTGPGLPPSPAVADEERPSADAVGGRGLWLARKLCPDLTLSSSPAGLTVRMFMPRRS